jgi:hypothetical protein
MTNEATALPLRDAEEVQEAHDFLGAVLQFDNRELFDSDRMEPEVRQAMHAAYDALCWVLKHDHNPAFGNNLSAIRELAQRNGIKLVRYTSHPE